MKFFTYTLSSSLDGNIFYVGKGSGCRFNQHLNDSKNGSPLPVHRKIRKVYSLGGNVIFLKVFETDDETAALEKEKCLIGEIGKNNLMNLTDGGEGISGLIMTNETKKKMSDSAKKYISHLTKDERIKRVQKAVEAARIFLTGRKIGTPSDSHRMKLSMALKGRTHSPERRISISMGLIGCKRHPCSQSTKLKIGIANKGKIPSFNARQKMRMAKLGKKRCPHSTETIERMRKSRSLYLERTS